MFDDTKVNILGNSPDSWQKTIYSGVQQFSSVVKIGEYEFSITKRLFVDYIEPLIEMDGYLEIENKIYKILNIKEYSDYMEVWLYLLKRQTEVI